MDEKARGFIEAQIDKWVQEEIVEDVEWIQEEMPISSLRDLALGHITGLIRLLAISIAGLESGAKEEYGEVEETIRGIIKRRLPEIIGKIERELGR